MSIMSAWIHRPVSGCVTDEYRGGRQAGPVSRGRERDKERFGYEGLINLPDR